MGNKRSQDLSLNALQMALDLRQLDAGFIHHSDRGSAYIGVDYQAKLLQIGAAISMNSKGNCYDNAVVESFFGNLKNELVHHQRFATREKARARIFDYIEVFYNRQRSAADKLRHWADEIRRENTPTPFVGADAEIRMLERVAALGSHAHVG